VKEYYKAQGSDIQDIVAKYKGIIEKEFIEGKTRGLPKVRFSVARKALQDPDHVILGGQYEFQKYFGVHYRFSILFCSFMFCG
jgi:hypothetical protein